MQGFFSSKKILEEFEKNKLSDISPFNERLINRVISAMAIASSEQMMGKIGGARIAMIPIYTVPRLMVKSPAFVVLCDKLIVDILEHKNLLYLGTDSAEIRTDLIKRVELVESMAGDLA